MAKRLLSRRTDLIDSSGIRKVFDLAAKMKDPINLSIGQPDFDLLPAVKERAKAAIDAGYNRYTQTRGLPELREAVSRKYAARGVKAEDSIITSGTSGGIMLALATILDDGDEVIIPDPYFVMYKHLVNFLGGKPVFVDTYPDFHLRRDTLEAALSERTKAIIVNSPNNPTGAVASWDTLKMVADLAKRNDLLVISDEIYDFFQYDSAPRSIAEIYPKTLVLNGFSKFAAMTGWRVGYALGPKELIAAMADIQQYSFVCAPSVGQHAALEALDTDPSEFVKAYTRKRDVIYEGLKDRFDVAKPRGAFYVFPGVRKGDGDEFVKKAIERSVLIVPGSVFSERRMHFRLSFAATDQTLERGIKVLNQLADELWKGE